MANMFDMGSESSLFNSENADIFGKGRLLLSNISIVGPCLKWTNDFNELKKFVREFIGLKGRWSAPGGGPKQFRCPIEDVSLTWYHEKQQTLIFQGKNGELLKTILVRKVGEVASTTNESQPKNINAKPIMDQVLSTDRNKVSRIRKLLTILLELYLIELIEVAAATQSYPSAKI